MTPGYRVRVRLLEEMHSGWDLDLRPPPDGPVSGAARQAGGSGLIRYVFSEDERGPYLEFYSFHRIWGDLHKRIYESGEVEHLAVLETVTAITGDPMEDAQRREQQHQRNRLLMGELEAAGLLAGGLVPGSFVMNAAIVTGIVDAEQSRPPVDEGDRSDQTAEGESDRRRLLRHIDDVDDK